ncbi:malate synthase G [Pseudomonas putida S11]|nr:malate synthase G [Pseudomonas putida S11]
MPNHPLQIAPTLQRFIEDEVLPGTGIEARTFWQGFSTLIQDLAPQNRALLAERERLQTELDNWHRQHPGPIRDMAAYQHFLQGIGYLVRAPGKRAGQHPQR